MSAVDRVSQALADAEIDHEIKHLNESAHTAKQAAQALDCAVSQIVKSLIFRTTPSAQPILALVSGDKRLNIDKLSKALDQRLDKADADFVKSTTGFTIGGVAPVGSLCKLPIYMDHSLFEYDTVWAAGGHPKTVFEITPNNLAGITGAKILDLTD